MGYFANATEQMMFEERICHNCQHYYQSDEMCPIMFIHWIYNYEECNSKSNAKAIMDMLIDNNDNDISKWKCAMFLSKEE